MKQTRNLKFLLLAGVIAIILSCNADKQKYFIIETNYGNMKIVLYDDTPLHRDNFEILVKDGFYDSLLFHRVMQGFMIQGGDPNSRGATLDRRLGTGGPGYQIPAEIGKPHLYGALAAARSPNPEKKSSGSQFYIVQGTKQTAASLDNAEKGKGITYNDEQRRIYIEKGGRPDLDMEYTVFGEVVEGLDVIEKIAAVQTGPNNRPVNDVIMKIRPASKN